ncbi:MAG TPA: hypothetical protein VNM92_13845 [Thermoanaerobaculia bacterium]|nr:hypothetical protein [Thermoanaerobaculia bacterium]
MKDPSSISPQAPAMSEPGSAKESPADESGLHQESGGSNQNLSKPAPCDCKRRLVYPDRGKYQAYELAAMVDSGSAGVFALALETMETAAIEGFLYKHYNDDYETPFKWGTFNEPQWLAAVYIRHLTQALERVKAAAIDEMGYWLSHDGLAPNAARLRFKSGHYPWVQVDPPSKKKKRQDFGSEFDRLIEENGNE